MRQASGRRHSVRRPQRTRCACPQCQLRWAACAQASSARAPCACTCGSQHAPLPTRPPSHHFPHPPEHELVAQGRVLRQVNQLLPAQPRAVAIKQRHQLFENVVVRRGRRAGVAVRPAAVGGSWAGRGGAGEGGDRRRAVALAALGGREPARAPQREGGRLWSSLHALQHACVVAQHSYMPMPRPAPEASAQQVGLLHAVCVLLQKCAVDGCGPVPISRLEQARGKQLQRDPAHRGWRAAGRAWVGTSRATQAVPWSTGPPAVGMACRGRASVQVRPGRRGAACRPQAAPVVRVGGVGQHEINGLLGKALHEAKDRTLHEINDKKQGGGRQVAGAVRMRPPQRQGPRLD